jgi:hypothetical protein
LNDGGVLVGVAERLVCCERSHLLRRDTPHRNVTGEGMFHGPRARLLSIGCLSLDPVSFPHGALHGDGIGIPLLLAKRHGPIDDARHLFGNPRRYRPEWRSGLGRGRDELLVQIAPVMNEPP